MTPLPLPTSPKYDELQSYLGEVPVRAVGVGYKNNAPNLGAFGIFIYDDCFCACSSDKYQRPITGLLVRE